MSQPAIAFPSRIPQDVRLTLSAVHEHEWNPVRTFCKIVVELSDHRWGAWFPQVPEIRLFGTRPTDAICKLLSHFGRGQFEASQIHVLHYAFYDGHLEYMVPMLKDRRIPIAPVNSDSVDLMEPTIRDRLDGHTVVFGSGWFEDSRGFD